MKRYMIIIALLFLAASSCSKQALTCGTVWDKGYDARGWYLIVDDRTVYVTRAQWDNTETNSTYCI